MRKQLDALRDGGAVVVTGDFNTTEDLPPYQMLTQPTPGDARSFALIDAYRSVHPRPEPNEASFNGFKGTVAGKRIDWILHSPEFTATGAAIDRTSRDGRYPSDHYPVTAELSPRR
jgi:endonuclease/exonuclease/phosphatase family metal-dependent hydrolase